MGVRQWKREVGVVVGAGGDGLSIKDLRIKFEVEKTVESSPNSAKIKIYNLHPDNENRIKDEFDEVLLNAGYKDNVGLIFRGNIKHVYRYREASDLIIEIEAADGDKDFRQATINQTFPAGSTNMDVIDASVDSFSGIGNTLKGPVVVAQKEYLRGKVVTGNSRSALDNVSKEAGANWSIQDGELHVIGVDDYLPGEVAVINPKTGMLGSPEVTEKGVKVKCLLNNLLKVNGQIELDMNTINEKSTGKGADKGGQGGRRDSQSPGVHRKDVNGVFKILNLKHKGDNRSSEWMSEMEAIFLEEAPVPETKPEAQ